MLKVINKLRQKSHRKLNEAITGACSGVPVCARFGSKATAKKTNNKQQSCGRSHCLCPVLHSSI
ncbi:hypothetical protein HanRHA438_Chr15g0682901 [Helianthus annuus]|nr:hypothetical protein HanRHA438_Chr15g0682901 [Helianthus annuus]